ncbi:unnamed protein product [Fraxinus pennsylvanica]|uniref:Josephin-like protein n=1 Tax=Fraxinus pennsylvanica TaxID=56036 RepID=A0AAD2A784_9LAMI|nr:unnamed protein product [Fraxinus pennsylvanica]
MPRVRFIPANEKPPICHKHGGGTKVGGNKKVIILWSFRPVKSLGFSPVRFFRGIGAKMARALQFVSTRKRYSRKVSLSSLTLAGSRSYAENLDSQRAEAIEDCIEFLNSSSSLQRSNSVESSC